MSGTTKILVVDDHVLFREGLIGLIGQDPQFDVVGQAADGIEALSLARTLQPHIVLMDIGLPGLNGIDATRKLLARYSDTKVIGLSMHSDPRFISEMLRAGASGYVIKDSAYEELKTALMSVIEGKVFLSPAVAGDVVSSLLSGDTDGATGLGRISPREREVLQLLAEGRSTAEIAELLHISSKTVETHRKNLMTKLDIHSLAGLTKFAVRSGLTSLEG